MTLWRFPNPWDYHELGAFLVVAATAEEAVALLKDFLRANAKDRLQSSEHAYYTDVDTEDWTADEAEAVGPVFVQGGCDD